MTRTIAALTLLFLVAISATAHAALQNTTTSRSHAGGAPPAMQLHSGVVAALHANHELAVQVLWTNHVPATASQSTRGPALAAMRASAKTRQQQHLRVRMLHDRYRIISIQLGQSKTNATAVVESNQNVRPSHLDGKPLGRAVELNERARIVLHRIGTSRRFVVWTLTLLK